MLFRRLIRDNDRFRSSNLRKECNPASATFLTDYAKEQGKHGERVDAGLGSIPALAVVAGDPAQDTIRRNTGREEEERCVACEKEVDEMKVEVENEVTAGAGGVVEIRKLVEPDNRPNSVRLGGRHRNEF